MAKGKPKVTVAYLDVYPRKESTAAANRNNTTKDRFCMLWIPAWKPKTVGEGREISAVGQCTATVYHGTNLLVSSRIYLFTLSTHSFVYVFFFQYVAFLISIILSCSIWVAIKAPATVTARARLLAPSCFAPDVTCSRAAKALM